MQEENGRRGGVKDPGGGPEPWATAGRLDSWLEEKPLPAFLVSLAVAAVLGGGAFLVGKSTGADLGQAEQQGSAVGTAKGAERGGARGYLAGFSRAKKKAYEEVYGKSYRRSYARAYGEAGLDEPELASIEVSR